MLYLIYRYCAIVDNVRQCLFSKIGEEIFDLQCDSEHVCPLGQQNCLNEPVIVHTASNMKYLSRNIDNLDFLHFSTVCGALICTETFKNTVFSRKFVVSRYHTWCKIQESLKCYYSRSERLFGKLYAQL